MSKSFFEGTTPSLRVAFLGFCIAVAGVALGFAGFAFELRSLSLVGYGVVVAGGLTTVSGILAGWVLHGRSAITDGIKSLLNLLSSYRSPSRERDSTDERER